MSTTASKETYARPENQIGYWTHRRIIEHFMRQCGESLTNREIAARVRLSYPQVHKRTAELEDAGTLLNINTKIENGNKCSVYKFNPEPQLFPLPKQLSFTAWAKKEHPEWIFEYEVKMLHKI
jgi:DNA-binding Lrp family transcriptional regulator